jgi:PadR family transcriptional regulator PadR
LTKNYLTNPQGIAVGCHCGGNRWCPSPEIVRQLDNAAVVWLPIAQAIEDSSGREVVQGSVYLTLDRLERKGLVSSRLGEPTAERGGRAKTYFRVTAKGLRAARQAHRTLVNLWNGVPQVERPAACVPI